MSLNLTKSRIAVGLSVLLALVFTLWMAGRWWNPFGRDVARLGENLAVADLILAHIADPRAAAGPGDGLSNGGVLVNALRALRAQPGMPAPEFVVVSGDLILPGAHMSPAVTSSETTPPRAETTAVVNRGAGTDTTRTAARSNQPRSSRAQPANTVEQTIASEGAYAVLGRALRESPTSDIFLLASDTLPADSLATVAATADSAGVRVYDLTQCFGSVGTSLEPCDIGAQYSLGALPPLPSDQTQARAIINDADSLISRAARDGRRVILVARKLPGSGTDTASQKTAALWTNLTSRDGVAAVLVRMGDGIATPAQKLVRTPALGRPGTRPSASVRGLSMVTLRGGVVHAELLRYDQAFRRSSTPIASRSTRPGLVSRFAQLGSPLGEPARSAILWIAVLTAFLTVAALWKVPTTIAETTTTVAPATLAAAGGAGSVSAAAPAPAPGGAVTTKVNVGDQGSVFQSNLGRTVLSGLTGIATVTLLKDVWGISGMAGQAWFAIVFIVAFLGFLVVSALLRALTEAYRDRVSASRSTVDLTGVRFRLWNRFRLWLASYRTTVVVFLDTFSSVLFGHAPEQLVVWAARYTELQEAMLAAVDRVREQVSDTVGDALRRAGIADARAERDYRVNVSLFAADGTQAFYVSTARGSLPKVFGEKSVAYVAIRSGEARWWKASYQGGHQHLRSTARLRGPDDTPPAAGVPVTDVVALDAAGTPTAIVNDQFQLDGVRGDKSAVSLPAQPVGTVGRMLALLNGQRGFGGGVRPAVFSIDADGYLLLAASGKDAASLAVNTLSLGAAKLGPFVAATANDLVLFHNVPEVFPGAGTDLTLKDHFEERGAPDYEAFIVIPVPFAQRGLTTGRRRVGIHISFSRAAFLNTLWPTLDRVVPDTTGDRIVPNYGAHRHVLTHPALADRVLEGVLSEAVRVLGEIVQPINDTWYWTRRRR